MITGRSISDTDAVDPHLLRTFACVARLGSFSAAAGELDYTQSAVSQQVASLETDLGVALLTRRPVAPTPAGARLLEHAGPLLLRLEAARADIARLTAAPAASLTVGVTPLAVTARFAAALARTRRAHPALQVTIQVTGRERLITAVASGKLDVGLTDGLAAPNDQLHLPDVGPLIAVGAGQSPLSVALPADHPLAGRPGLGLLDLADARWIDAPDAGIPLEQLRVACRTDGFRPGLRYAGTDVAGLITLAAAGHGLAVLPHLVLASHPAVSAVPVTDPRLVHRTEILHASSIDGPATALEAALTGG